MTWPISNRAESLTVDFHYLQRRVGSQLGFDRNPAIWDDEEAELVQEIIDDGVRQAYFPPPLSPPYSLGTLEAHSWSFMRPTWEFTTVSGQRRYELPPDYDSPVGDLVFLDTNNSYPAAIHTSAVRLDKLESRDTSNGSPRLFATEAGESTGEDPQTQVLVLHPTPDGAYRMSLKYQAAARRLTADQPYPLGGQLFGPVLVASCLSMAEQRLTGKQGPLFNAFLSALAGGIRRDHKREPKSLGIRNGWDAGFTSRSAARRNGWIGTDHLSYDGDYYFD